MKFLDEQAVKPAFDPADLNTAAITGNRISLAKGDRVAVILTLGDSLTGGVVSVTLRQHTAASAGTSKDLSVQLPYFKKIGAATKFTKVEPTVAAANYVLSADYDTEPGQVVFEVEAQDLDVNNGFTHFSIDLADAGVARNASAIYVLSEIKQGLGSEIDV